MAKQSPARVSIRKDPLPLGSVNCSTMLANSDRDPMEELRRRPGCAACWLGPVASGRRVPERLIFGSAALDYWKQ